MGSQPTSQQVESAYALAKERYAALGVDTDKALDTLAGISISLHCWQADDVGGFENPGEPLSGGIAAFGNYPGKPRNADEMRRDLDKVYSMLPGSHRLALHMIYAETGGQNLGRNGVQPEHFARWVDWAKANGHGLDMNQTMFGHPMADSGFTLSSYDDKVREFWIEHCILSRHIGKYFGESLGTPCVTNLWIPDGMKDTPIDRKRPRELLTESLDAIYAEKIDPRYNLDSVEGKLFGLGSESYVVGSHEFYLGYAITRKILLTLDSGHFHPTETIVDKISSVMQYVDDLMLHVSRNLRWDSDHVVVLSDELQGIMQEVVRGGFLDRVHIGLDYFDASINRVAAYVIGARNAQRGLLLALLEPIEQMRAFDVAGDYTSRLAMLEDLKGMPFGAVWDMFCQRHNVPVGIAIMDDIRAYEKAELSKRA